MSEVFFYSDRLRDILQDAENRIYEELGIKMNLRVTAVKNMAWQRKVAATICDEYGVTWEQIRSKRRSALLVQARQCFIYFVYQRGVKGYSLTSVGRMLDRDHSTILTQHQRVNDYLLVGDEIMLKAIATIRKRLKDTK